jgi:hypothetical protein
MGPGRVKCWGKSQQTESLKSGKDDQTGQMQVNVTRFPFLFGCSILDGGTKGNEVGRERERMEERNSGTRAGARTLIHCLGWARDHLTPGQGSLTFTHFTFTFPITKRFHYIGRIIYPR